MKSFIVFALLVVAAAAAPAGPEAGAQILRSNLDNIGTDGFSYDFETSNGLKQEAQGIVKNPGSENPALEVRGSYSYPGPDGVLYVVQYIANELGFQPQGAHLPV